MSGPSKGKNKLVVILGPTASGKTALSLEIASIWPAEIISADSRQIYRAMDVGTAKVTPAQRAQAPHHLLDLIEPDQVFSVSDFVGLARPLAQDIQERGLLPLVVGGTGLYIKGLTEGILDAPSADEDLRRRLHLQETTEGAGTLHRLLADIDPQSAASIHPNNTVRIVRALEVYYLGGQTMSEMQQSHGFSERPFEVLKIGVLPPKQEHEQMIARRTRQMFEQGMIEEVAALLEKGYCPESSALKTLGYRETVLHLRGELSLEETIELVRLRTRQYAKRQMTWFRKEEEIIWVDSCREFVKIRASIENFMHI